MPVKNENESEGEGDGDVSGAESEHSNSSQGHESSDEEANEMESDESSEMDMADIEKRRLEYCDYLSSLEAQFATLRELYYFQRHAQIENQLNEVRIGRSEEYLQPLKELDKAYRNRLEVADKLHKYKMDNIEHSFTSEELAAEQHFESEKLLAYDQLHDELIERIRRLEEDRHNSDITWADWGTDKRTSKVRGPGRKKAVTVTGPYLVYMLPEDDIMEDWTTIRKALKRSAAAAAAVA